jgi:hypothetical protein
MVGFFIQRPIFSSDGRASEPGMHPLKSLSEQKIEQAERQRMETNK